MSCMLAVIILLVNSGYIATQTDSVIAIKDWMVIEPPITLNINICMSTLPRLALLNDSEDSDSHSNELTVESCDYITVVYTRVNRFGKTPFEIGFTAHVYHTSLRWDSSDDMISMKVANFSNGLVMGQYKDSDSQISRFFQGWVTSVQVEEDLVSYTNEHPVNKTLFSQNFKNEILLSYDSAIATVTGASMATQFDSGSLTAVKS
ncbi:uncharacterized protein [Ptychodera flava]|uniref:uncharacterized protein isoform X1 n=1 Tax=Ptychodera flava TaxID=63121 RepID=UPI00396A572E